MKLLLLIISLMFYKSDPHSKNTYYINKDLAVQKLNESIPLFQTISNEIKITNEFNNSVLPFNINDFKEIENLVFLTGEISKEYLSVNFWVQSLDQLNNFNQGIASSFEFGNIKFKFINMVISLINNIFQSPILPKEDIELSSHEESNFLTSIRNLLIKENKNKVTISVTHDTGTRVIFHCYLNKNAHNVVRSSKPNESEEHEKATLIDKKRQ